MIDSSGTSLLLFVGASAACALARNAGWLIADEPCFWQHLGDGGQEIKQIPSCLEPDDVISKHTLIDARKPGIREQLPGAHRWPRDMNKMLQDHVLLTE